MAQDACATTAPVALQPDQSRFAAIVIAFFLSFVSIPLKPDFLKDSSSEVS